MEHAYWTDLSSSLSCIRVALLSSSDTVWVLVQLVFWVSLTTVLHRPYFRSFDLLRRIARM